MHGFFIFLLVLYSLIQYQGLFNTDFVKVEDEEIAWISTSMILCAILLAYYGIKNLIIRTNKKD